MLLPIGMEITLPRKHAQELRLVRPLAPMATVEIDLDTLPPASRGYAAMVRAALAPLADDDPDLCTTVYVYQCTSHNFGVETRSAFFGVAGDRRALAALFASFRRTPGLRVRHSDYIVESQAASQYHLEDGALWSPHEGHLWQSDNRYEEEFPARAMIVERETVTA